MHFLSHAFRKRGFHYKDLLNLLKLFNFQMIEHFSIVIVKYLGLIFCFPEGFLK